jgi:translation elongation factor EF-G
MEGGPAVAYITKMQPFSSRLYDIVTRGLVKSEGPIRYVAFSKVFCGTLKRGQTVYAMGPKHGINGQVDMIETKIDHLFILMGSSI